MKMDIDAKTPERRRSSIGVCSGPMAVSPIQALNPYSSRWNVKAKIIRKGDKRSFTKNDQTRSVFNVHIVDEQGTESEATFWGTAADTYHDDLEEGKVYFFSNFNVRPANRNFCTVNCDYTMHLEERSTVQECPDQDTSKMTAKLDITPIEKLEKFLGRKVLVSVMGVVVDIGSLGTVKRKADSTELVRRDITIVDKSLKSVVVTLWGEMAEKGSLEVENAPNGKPVVVLTSCRVTDFSGLSLSTVKMSELKVNPNILEAQGMKEWYDSIGCQEEVKPLTEGMPVANSGKMNRTQDKLLKDIQPEELPPLDAKPTYAVVNATVTHINPDQTLFYLANTENQRKVVEQEGRYFCEYDGKYYDTAEYRYIVLMRTIDMSTECYLNVFNKEAESILGCPASEMAELRKNDEKRYTAILKEAEWKPFLFRVASKSNQNPTNGNMRMRHNVVALHDFNWATSGRKMLDSIKKYGAMC